MCVYIIGQETELLIDCNPSLIMSSWHRHFKKSKSSPNIVYEEQRGLYSLRSISSPPLMERFSFLAIVWSIRALHASVFSGRNWILAYGWMDAESKKKEKSFFLFFYIKRQKKKRLLRCPRMAQRHGKVASHENKEKRKFYFLYVYIRVTLLRLLHIVPPPSSWVSCIHEKKNKGKASLVCLLSTTEPECSSEWCHFPFPSFTLNHVLSLFILWTPLLRRVELNLASKWRNERPNTICTQHTYTYRKKARLIVRRIRPRCVQPTKWRAYI